jgi:outer membrane protein assembly factor BamB
VKKVLLAGLTAAWILSTTVPSSATTPTQWSQFLGGPSHYSYSADPAISTSNASSYGVKWMANLFSADLGSPVVAYSATLGKEVVYVGDERADVYAIDAGTGQVLWSTNLGVGDAERDTPAVAPDGSVWIGTNWNATMYKLDGATGSVLCSLKSPDGKAIMGSPMIVTPAGGVTTVYWDAVDSGVNGPFVATNESTCAQEYDNTVPSGSWVTPAYSTDSTGEPLVLTGTADPNGEEFAFDANTGATVWSYSTYHPPTTPGWDIGVGATVTPPGVNGFADGVAYFTSEYGYEEANDLKTGALLWIYKTYPDTFGGKRYVIASTAMDGNTMVYGYFNGLVSLNATTGTANWVVPTGPIDTSPAILGPAGSEVVAYADLYGAFHLASLSTGSTLYNFQTGSYITSSPADYNGTVYIASADGFLYAFEPGGGNGTKGSETISAPTTGSTVANPNGSLTISGTATDGSSVSAVEIVVQSGGSSGPYYDAATNSWNSAPIRNEATLASPGSSSTNWTFSLPVPAAGENYEVFANTVNSKNLVDKGSVSYFTVSPSLNEPTIHTSSYDVTPGATFTATGNAFKPGETATFTLFGNTVATATVGATGNVPQTKIQVPSTASFGPTSLTVTGNTSGKAASTTVFVSNQWMQYGYSSLKTAMEPNDYVIAHTIFAGASIMNVDWKYSAGGAINDSPAILDGIAYFGDDSGTLNAVRTSAGSPVWTYKIPSGQPIRSSPAIDENGNIIFGANDGNVYILNSSGASVATKGLGGNLGAPAYDNGNIFIASSTGMVYMLTNVTLATNWSANAGAPVTAAPAYDGGKGLAFAANSNGLLTAYSSATGAVKWTASATMGINAIAVAGGNVYAGSNDGYVYAFNESTGALAWKLYIDGSAITALDANGSGPAIGTAKGYLADINANGKIYFGRNYPKTTSPIEGLAGAGTDEFATNQAGQLELLRVSDGGFQWDSGAHFSAPPVVLDGVLFAGSQDSTLYALAPQGYNPPPQSSVRVGAATITIDGTGCTTAN